MVASTTTFAEALFINYLPDVIETYNTMVNAKRITKGKVKNWEGKQLQKTVSVVRSGAVAAIDEGGPWPVSKARRYQEAIVKRKFCVGKVAPTIGAMNTARTSEKAAVKLVQSEYEGLLEDMSCFQNFFWTRGTVNGVVGTVQAGVTASTTIYVDDARGFWEGVTYSVLNPTTFALVTTFTVANGGVTRAFDNTNNRATLTATSAITCSADDIVVWGTGDYRSYGRVISGLKAGINENTGLFQGINGTDYPRWTSPVLGNSGTLRDLTPSLMRLGLGYLVQEGGKVKGLTALGSTWLISLFETMWESAIRITPDTKTNGLVNPAFQSALGKVSLEIDKDAPYHTLFLFDPAQITYAIQAPLAPQPVALGEGGDAAGSGIFMLDGGNSRYMCMFLEQSELFYEQRNRMMRIDDLNETIGSAF